VEQAGSHVPKGLGVAMRKFEDKTQVSKAECENMSLGDNGKSPIYPSQWLFKTGHEIQIDHNGAIYTLRVTRSGGLILNK
jgi:hemin uptake protein HemP